MIKTFALLASSVIANDQLFLVSDEQQKVTPAKPDDWRKNINLNK
jgi:hypothetical protein